MKPRLKRALAGALGLAAALTVVPLVNAPAAYAAPTNSGSADITPNSSTNSNDTFTLTLPAGATCPGDSADGGWRVTSYLVAKTTDPATLMFSTDGPVPQQYGTPQASFLQPLSDQFGSPYVVGQTAAADPAGGPGNIINIPNFTFAVFEDPDFSIPPGEYNLGIACFRPTGPESPIDKFWNNTITVTSNPTDPGPAKISWAEGTVDTAPTLNSVTPGDATLTAAFTHAPSDPANTTYTATATPAGGGTAVTETGTGSPIVIDGITNGTEYWVTVRASNLTGDSPESNALTGTPVAGAQPAVGNLTATPDPTEDSGIVNLDWDAPVGGESTPTGYTVAVSPTAGTVVQPNPGGDATSAQVTGLTPGTQYTFTVTPVHPDPFVGTPASVQATPVASGVTILEQNVTVTRPAGALLFTQRCETDIVGNPTTPGTPFGDAPCAIAFGVAERVIPDGGGAPYFAAEASLNNVQVDSNGDDTGWTVTGDMSEFIHEAHVADPAEAPTNMRFSGDQLGWDPIEVSKTGGLDVNLGDAILPGTTLGMSANPTLASSPSPGSLGIAEFDADLDLVFPITKRAGEYSGTLTMTATPGG